MTLADLIRRFRTLAGDKTAPFFWKDEDIIDWLNDAQAQACVRARLLLEDADPAMCRIAIEADRHTYPLHAKMYELALLSFKAVGESRGTEVKVVSRGWLDEQFPGWRDEQRATGYAIQGETSIRLVSTPAKAGVLTIEAYRLPREVMALPSDKPEIHEASHVQLIDWALHKAFSIPDSEAFDPQRSGLAEDAFTAYFGLLPDVDMRRITREDTPQTNKVHL